MNTKLIRSLKKAAAWTLLALMLVSVAGCQDSGTAGDAVYMTKISDLMNVGGGNLGVNQRYAGVVEAQATKQVQKDDSYEVAEIYVEVNDVVKTGDPLFSYDISDMQLKIDQLELEIEKMQNSVVSQQKEIETLEKQAKNATGDTLLQYTIEIQEANVSLKETEYEIKSKQLEAEKYKESMNDAIVTSPMDGVIQKINKGSDSGTSNYYYSSSSSSDGFITIVATGEYRIKGTINEQNVYLINSGDPVTIRSRADESVTWSGYIDEIDTSGTVESGNNNYYHGDDEMSSSSKYAFYVQLDSYDGLMMGQHVYIEMGGSESAEETREGIWLYEGYFIFNEEDPSNVSVWVDNNGKLALRQVTLGEYDENMGEYNVTDGLTEDDAICMPEEGLTEGQKTEMMKW